MCERELLESVMIFEMTNVWELIAAGQDEETHFMGSEKIPGIHCSSYLIVFMRPSSKGNTLKGHFIYGLIFLRN